LLINSEGNVIIGKPYINTIKIKGKIIEHLRSKKNIIYKMKSKKKTRRKYGHRQELTRVLIEGLDGIENFHKSKLFSWQI